MSKRFFVLLLLVALSIPSFAAPSRDDGDRHGPSTIARIIHRIVHALDNFDLGFPKP